MISERRRQLLIDIVTDLAGEDAKSIALVLLSMHQEATDEEISQILNMRLSDVRRSLYDLADIQIAQSRKIRNKKTGWYVYYWRLLPERVFTIVKKKQEDTLNRLNIRLDFERDNVTFSCNTASCKKYSFDESMQHDFTCPDCLNRLESLDNAFIIRILEGEITKLKKLDDEISVLHKEEMEEEKKRRKASTEQPTSNSKKSKAKSNRSKKSKSTSKKSSATSKKKKKASAKSLSTKASSK